MSQETWEARGAAQDSRLPLAVSMIGSRGGDGDPLVDLHGRVSDRHPLLLPGSVVIVSARGRGGGVDQEADQGRGKRGKSKRKGKEGDVPLANLIDRLHSSLQVILRSGTSVRSSGSRHDCSPCVLPLSPSDPLASGIKRSASHSSLTDRRCNGDSVRRRRVTGVEAERDTPATDAQGRRESRDKEADGRTPVQDDTADHLCGHGRRDEGEKVNKVSRLFAYS